MATLMSLLVKLGVESGDFDKGLGDAEQQTNRFKSNVVGNLASVGNAALATFAGLAGGAVTGFGAMAKEGIEMNKFLELSKLQFTTLMGSADEASKHVEMLFKVAASTPFEANQIIGASKSLLTFGGAALDTQQNILMVGDAAAATGADIGEVSNWVGRAYSAIQAGRPFGEAAQRLQEMGILSADARNELENLQKSGADSATVWAAMTKTFGKFNGAMKLQAGTWEGLTSTIKDNISMGLGKAFAPLFDVFKNVLGKVADFTGSDLFTGWMDNIKKVVGSVSVALSAFLDGGLKRLFTTFEDGSNYITPILEAFGMTADRAEKMGGRIAKVASVMAGAFEVGGLKQLFTTFEDGSSYVSSLLQIFGVTEAAANSWGATINNVAKWVIDVFGMVSSSIQNDSGVMIAIVTTLGLAIAAAAWTALAPMLPIIATFALVAAAVYVLYTAWTQNWGGIQQATAAAWAYIQPVIQNIITWFQANLPTAIAALSAFWTGTLLPAMQAVGNWFMTVFIPALSQLWTWLSTNIPAAISTLSGYWSNTLLPAILMVYNFLAITVFPLFQAIGNFIATVFTLAVTVLAGVWQNILVPALSAVWNLLTQLWTSITGQMTPALNTLSPIVKLVADFFGVAFVGALNGILTIVGAVTAGINTLTNALQNIKLPAALTPGSPTPFEIGLLGINDALKAVANTGLPNLTAGLQLAPSLAGGIPTPSVPAASSAGAGGTIGGGGSDVSALLQALIVEVRNSKIDEDRLARSLSSGIIRGTA